VISLAFRRTLVEEVIGSAVSRAPRVFVIEYEHSSDCPKLVRGECTCGSEPAVGEAIVTEPDHGPINVAPLRERLRRYVRDQQRKGVTTKATLIQRVLDQEALLKPGDTTEMRTNAARRLAGILAFMLPDAGEQAITALVRPSLEAADRPDMLGHALDVIRTEYAKARRAYDRAQERNRRSWARLGDELKRGSR
jgi:hypothetical protein